MVIEADHLYQIRASALIIVLEILFDNLLEPVNDKLFLKGWVSLLSLGKLFIRFVLISCPLQMKESKAQPQLCTARKLLNPHPVHPLKLFK